MGIIKFLKNVGKEMKKVTWPKGKELTRYTITVITTVIFFAIFCTHRFGYYAINSFNS